MEQNADIYNEYYETMSKLLDYVQKLRVLEIGLTDAAAERDTDRINQLIQDSQPDLLAFKGLDRKRGDLEKEMGISGMGLGDIFYSLPYDEQVRISPVFEDLQDELERFEKARDNADRIMKVRLSDVNAVIEQTHAKPVDQFANKRV